ncbi:hypothetical protein BH10PSE12_BH10PSE12_14190 [soil metagenome]
MSDEDIKPFGEPSGLQTDAPVAEPSVQPVAALPRPRKRKPLLLILLVLLGFVTGAGLTLWASPRIVALWADQPAPSRLPMVNTGPRVVSSPRPIDAATQDLLGVRIAELEDRLTRITVEAQAASGNAARAEGLLVAVAARRSLDSGTPLGYIEGQLRLRFGQAQPRAVATIINAAREPVTLVDLQSELDDIGPHLTGNPPGSSWWTALSREARELVIIRKAATPSRLPDRAYRRARQLLETGRVDDALAEVERLPGRDTADRWMQMARRYREARRALDLIETAAILEPRQMRASDGGLVSQTSPFAP